MTRPAVLAGIPGTATARRRCSAYLAEVYGAEASKQTITAITDRVMEGMAEWQSRPLDAVYAVIFIDAINVKIREGQVANRPVYLALGVTVDVCLLVCDCLKGLPDAVSAVWEKTIVQTCIVHYGRTGDYADHAAGAPGGGRAGGVKVGIVRPAHSAVGEPLSHLRESVASLSLPEELVIVTHFN